MDWTQASGIEWFVFSFGALMLFMLAGLGVAILVFFVGSFIVQKIERFKRFRKTTRALWCGRCSLNVDGKCEYFGIIVDHAPVRRPGCSWGIEGKESGDD